MKSSHAIVAAFVAAFIVLGIAFYQYEIPVPTIASASSESAP